MIVGHHDSCAIKSKMGLEKIGDYFDGNRGDENRREISMHKKEETERDGGGKMRSYVRTKDTKCPKNKLMIPCLLLIYL